MKNQTVFLTGDKELNKKLGELEAKTQKKYLRKALRGAAKDVADEFRSIVPVDTGAFRDTAKVRATKRSRNKIGSRVVIERDKLRQTRESRGGRLGYDRKRNEDAFYAAMVELDDAQGRPLRTALYQNENRTRRAVENSLRRMVAEENR